MLDDDVVYDNGFFSGMSWFGAFRNHYGFTWYSDFRTPVTIDFALVAVVYFCVLLCVATLVSTLGIRGRERWSTTLRASYAVGLGTIILVCLVGHNWQEGYTQVTTQYIYRTDYFFSGTIGLRVALHGVNVTLDGYYGGPHGGGYAYYAEDVKWADYGKEHEMISAYLDRGLPHPILTVMDFLSVDEGGLRWGRNYHSAGYFACALLWTAFVFWIIANVLLLSVVSYGAFMFFLTGVAMVMSCVVYHVCQPPRDLQIYFGEAVLTVRYGWCFWLTLASGILTTLLGFLLLFFDNLFHDKLAEFFNLETLDEDDLPDFTPASSFVKAVPSLTNPGMMCKHRGSFQQSSRNLQPGQRRLSLFLEPERRPSDYTSGMRKGSLFAATQSFAGLGVHNKAFEKERSKSNPIFNSATTNHIQEENEDAEKSGDVRIEVGGEDTAKYGNRKPSLATMREHRENHMNEQQQKQTTSLADPTDDGDERNTPTEIVVHCPSDDDVHTEEGDVTDDAMNMTSDKAAFIAVGFAMNGGGSGLGTKRGPHEYAEDSGIVSANNSPMDSEKTSTCGDHDD